MVLTALAVVMVGLLAVGGVLLIVRSRVGPGRKPHPACGRCGYDVTATVTGGTGVCPECGSALVEVGVLPPRGKGRRDPAMMVVGIAMLVFVTACGGSLLIGVAGGYRRAAARQQAIAAQQRALAAQQQQEQQDTAQPAPNDTDEAEHDQE